MLLYYFPREKPAWAIISVMHTLSLRGQTILASISKINDECSKSIHGKNYSEYKNDKGINGQVKKQSSLFIVTFY